MSREELPFEVIQTWKPEQLKEFCRKRDLKVSGTKACVFSAAEMGISIKPNALIWNEWLLPKKRRQNYS